MCEKTTTVKKLEWSAGHILECCRDIEKLEKEYGFTLTDEQYKKLSSAITKARNAAHGMMMEGCRQVVTGELQRAE